MRYLLISISTILAVLSLTACGGEASPESSAEPAAATTPGGEKGGRIALMPSLAEPRPATPPAVLANGAAASGEIDFDLPSGWIAEAPLSSMRLAQAAIQGEAGTGQLAVFFFGTGQGGGVEANLERWIGQMDQDPGTEPRRDSFEAGNLKITWVEVRGTLKPSGMGMGPTTPQPGSAMLAAVVEGPGGPWFFKATGPAGTLLPQKEAFFDLLKSVRPAA